MLLCILFYVLLGGVFLSLQCSTVPLTYYPDSQGYLDYAQYITRCGKGDCSAPPPATEIRSIGYPALIAAAKLLFAEEAQAIAFLHGICFMGVIFLVLLQLRAELPLLCTFAAALFPALLAGIFFVSILSEWVSINLLILLTATIASVWGKPSKGKIFSIGFLLSCLVLTRPALTPAFIIVPLLLSWKTVRRATTYLCLGCVPVFLGLAVGFYRFGSVTLVPFSGLSFFGTASLVACAPTRATDTDDFVMFVHEVARNGACNTVGSLQTSSPQDLEILYNRNLWEIGNSIRVKQGWSIPYWNQLASTYAWRVIATFPTEWGRFVLAGFASHFQHYHSFDRFLIYLVLLIAARWYRLGQHRSLTTTLCLMFIIHVACIGGAALTNIVFYRLFAVTYFPLMFAMLLIAGGAFNDIARKILFNTPSSSL